MEAVLEKSSVKKKKKDKLKVHHKPKNQEVTPESSKVAVTSLENICEVATECIGEEPTDITENVTEYSVASVSEIKCDEHQENTFPEKTISSEGSLNVEIVDTQSEDTFKSDEKTAQEVTDLRHVSVEKLMEQININDSKTDIKVIPSIECKNSEENTSSLNTILNKNKVLADAIKNEQMSEQFKNIDKHIETSKSDTVNFIKPYTEKQLSALYTNTELDTLEEFSSQYVEAELKGLATKQHPLYELLSNYQHIREKITGNNLELEQFRKEYRELQLVLWTIDTASVTKNGECQDGCIVTAVHTYNKATFHRTVFQSIIRILGNIRKLIYENHVLYSYSAEDLRLQIELYLQTSITNCINVTQLDRNAGVALSLQSEPLHLKPYISEVRLCISVIFAFQRKLIRDSQFIKETRDWLNRLVALLLRVANYQDHLFILNHILRCPAGIGSWASCFIQTPIADNLEESPFSSYQINHILTILACLLMPIRDRDKFLEDIAQPKESSSDTLWVMVDSEGEEDDEPSGTSLKENDLVALLNQLPLESLFKSILLVQRRNFKDEYVDTNISDHHVLRFLAFSTILLKILYRGLQTYNQPRYNQFSKRLSRFIRHVVQYATDQLEQFQKNQNANDLAMMQRLQVEYDAFFLRAIYYLYSSQKLGAWQFLAVVPYNIVTIKSLWKIFYFLHDADSAAKDILNPLDSEDYSKKLWDVALRTQFEEKLSSLEDGESYYLLNTFANMALARDETDIEFIRCCTLDLLQVGYISEATQDNCSKSSRILLTHITSKYPFLLSIILKNVKDNMEDIGSLALHLYEELPLSIWKLTETDLEILSRLLLTNPLTSNETKLARMILSRLNWDFENPGELFLPYYIHYDTAILVLNAVDQEPNYSHWGWQTILRLKLHLNDKGFTDISKVPDVESVSVLCKGIREQQLLPSFASVLMTSSGHLVPLICTKGLSQLIFLQANQKYEAVLFALYTIVPVFINCQECLINSEKFQEVLTNMLNADRSYISMAKVLVGVQSTVLQQFGNMIETQIVNFQWYNLESPRCLVRLWINSLVSIPNWNKDGGVMYLLDVIIRAAFFHTDALEVCQSILKDLLKESSPQELSGTITSLFKWVSSSSTNGSLIASSLSNCTWLAYVVIDIEFEERERKTGLWRELLTQLNHQKGKINVDAAIKKAANVVKVPSFTSGSLCLYRWAQQAMDTPVDHPLLPLIWQKFFMLYLARIPVVSAIDKGCIGDKFFEGIVNFSFLKRIKKRLQDSVEHYQNLVGLQDEEEDLEKKHFRSQVLSIFRAYSLWLEEPSLQERNLLLPSLPPQYQANLLAMIMQGHTTPWYEYLDYNKIKQDQLNCIRMWRVANFREKSNVNKPLLNPGSRAESRDPVERILRRLTSYDAPKAPPTINRSSPIVAPIDFSSKEALLKSLDQSFKTLKQFAHNQTLKLSEHKALDCSYQELVPQLYRSVLNKAKKKVPCKGKNQTVHCSGAAVIILEMQEARVNERIEHQIQTNRNAYESLVAKSIQAPAISLCSSSVTIQQAVKILQSQTRCNPGMNDLGVELFYVILAMITEETTSYLPTRTLFSSCLEKLGQTHIVAVESEMPRLLEKILKEPQLGTYLAPHFSPLNVGTTNLIQMYSTICMEIGQKYDVAFALLSKFDIENWLQKREPKLSQRSQFIECVIEALTTLGFEPQLESLVLQGLYRKHLLSVFEFQFPEHYGEILIHLLKASNGSNDSSLLPISVWMDILNSLARPSQVHLKVPIRDQLRQYAQHQQVLSHQELVETAELLSRHFTQERLQYGLYGLYPKCRNYIDIFVLLLGMTGHALIISSINTYQGLLGDKMCEKIWPHLRDMFAPWIVPYSMQNLKDNMASWIQQLADDRSILLPWIPADSPFAQKLVNVFFECILFIMQTLPACHNILSFVWQWYVSCFAHTSVKDHILNHIHHSFLVLPWQNFWPSVTDVEGMLRVVDQYLPESHYFLGHIFMQVNWSNWLNNFTNTPNQVKMKVYQGFLTLLVKLCKEPNVRSRYSEKAKSLLVQAETFNWTVLDSTVYQHIMDWYVLSCDSFVIFKMDPLDLDFRVLHFLKAASGYDKPLSISTNNALNKRLIYVRSYIKLLSVFTSKYKASIPSKQNELASVISQQLVHLESVCQTREEMGVLLNELLCILNISSISDITLNCFNKWILNKPGDGIAIKVLLQTLGTAVSDHNMVTELYENTLNSYFQNNVSESFDPTWKEIGETLKLVAFKQTELEQTLLNKGCILTLNAILVQRIAKGTDNEILLNACMEWMMNIKISEQIEPKIPLIWFEILYLCYNHCSIDQTYTGSILYKFAHILLEISEDKGNSSWSRGLLTAIGISKQNVLSLNFRFLCRALAGYVLAQLPDMKGEPQIVRFVANALAKVGQPGGNSECPKILLKLDFGQSQGKLKECAELALNQIQDANNSLHNARNFLSLLLKQFYIKPYLKEIG